MRSYGRAAALAVLLLAVFPGADARAQSPPDVLLADATSRDASLRKEIDARKAGTAAVPLLTRARTLTQTYRDLAQLFPRDGVSDDALWQGASLAADAYWEFGQPEDRATALTILRTLQTRYPGSPFLKQVPSLISRLTAAPVARIPPPPVPVATPAKATAAVIALMAIRREVLPDALRVTLELEGEAVFSDERMEAPARVVVDLQNTRVVDALKDATLTFPDDVVRQIRVGRQQGAATRVVLYLSGAQRHSVYAMYSPYRVVIDLERSVAAIKSTTNAQPALAPKLVKAPAPKTTVVADTSDTTSTAPAPPIANMNGSFSLSRQLGLGVARIVIDPGHGGHDPGAQARGLTEADLTLDIALRLEKLLLKQRGVEVVLTRRTKTYVPLDERTAMANRAAADLFLSIHANASADDRARGIETYFLNFSSNAAAEAVAARENAGSNRTMRELPNIVKAIALNNKIDESRDFAAFVQDAMFERLQRANRTTRNLGVKQAPFVVLIGATMPSILAEISFLTNSREAAWLRTSRYRDQLAEALFNGVMKYQTSLKASQRVAER